MGRVKKRARKLKNLLSKADLRELRLWGENDATIYRQVEAFAKNYARKKIKGTYKRTLAIKGLANNLVPNIIKSYNRKIGKTYHRINSADKKKLAQMILPQVTELADWFKKNRGALKRGR